MSRLNMTPGMDQSRVKRFGKLFGSIDFEMNENLNQQLINTKRNSVIVGDFMIGGKKYPLTMHEVNQILGTMEAAKEVFFKSYTIGRY